jgi:TetR/AcrR family fatty acid metabolism transcriptional regulator
VPETPEPRSAGPAGADPEKRKRILEAAVRTFGRRGFHDAKIADIAAAARVAEGTVSLYFRNKEALLGTVFDETMDDLLARGRQIAASPALAAERLTGLVDLHLRILGSDRDLASLFQIELRRSARLMERVIRVKLVDYFRLLGGVVKEGIASGEFRADLESRLAVRILFGAADEILSEWLLGGEAEPIADARKLVGTLLDGFSAADGPSRAPLLGPPPSPVAKRPGTARPRSKKA